MFYKSIRVFTARFEAVPPDYADLGKLDSVSFFTMQPVTASSVTLSAQAVVDKLIATMPMAAIQCMPKDWLN
jgi:hypothetical protein